MSQHYYASVRRRGELEKEVEYWKERAEENQQAAWNDGAWTAGLGVMVAMAVLATIVAILWTAFN